MTMVHVAPPAPRLADGACLLGEYQDSGCRQTPYLVRRSDGRMLEISRLLHLVAAALDGTRDADDVAARVGPEIGRAISGTSITYLIEHKLSPLGLIADADGPAPLPPTGERPLLGLTLHAGVIPPRIVRAMTTVLRPLFLPPVVVAALTALVAVDAWLLLAGRALDGVRDVGARPEVLLLVMVMTIVGGAFHELGHATASRYGGAEPGVIGAGVYLIWPVFYNDLNDCHRLGRTARLRADLGGVYFNVIFVLVLVAGYGLTGHELLLVVAALQHLAILHQLMPFLRLDGYYVVSDLAGVPDLFRRIGPTLSSLVPWRTPVPAVGELKPRARTIVTAWVAVTVPLLAGSVVLVAFALPQLLAAVAGTWRTEAPALIHAWRGGSPSEVLALGLHLLVLAVPVVGLGVTAGRGLRRGCRSGVHRRAGRTILRFGAPA